MSEQNLTGYPSIDKPWLKYYSEEAINTPLPECTIFEYLYENNKDHLDDIAIEYFGKKIAYRELFKNIDEVASALKTSGVKQGQIITICCVALPEVVYAVYALNKLGAIPNLIDPRTSVDGIEKSVIEAKSNLCITLDLAAHKFLSLIDKCPYVKVISVSPTDSLSFLPKLFYKFKNKQTKNENNGRIFSWSDFVNSRNSDFNISQAKDNASNTAIIVHTGGTTGTPKGVQLTNKNLNSLSQQFRFGVRDFSRGYRFLDIIPPFVAYGMCGGIHSPLTCGMTVILVPKFDPEHFDDLLLRCRPTHFMGVPTYFQQLFTSKKMKNRDLSRIVFPAVGGDSMNIQLEKTTNAFLKSHNESHPVIKGYGLTEVCSAACGCVNDLCNEEGSVGIPFVGNTISVFKQGTHEELTYNQIGEICISGPTVMSGYYANEAETEIILQQHTDGTKWIHSGDIGYMTEDGIVHIIDRIKRIIIASGWKIFPSTVEEAILHHSAVAACAVVGVDEAIHIHVPVAFIELKEKATENIELIKSEIFELCEKYLPEYAFPASLFFIDKIPHTSIGKVDWRTLEKEGRKNG